MLLYNVRVRSAADVPMVEGAGYRCRQHLAALEVASVPGSSADEGIGALRVFDEVAIDPGSRFALVAHEGLEVLVYVLEGECNLEDAAGRVTLLVRDAVACAVLGRGSRYGICNPSPTSPVRVLVAAFVAADAHPWPGLAVRSLAHGVRGIAWFASHAAEASAGAVRLGLSARMGLATLEPGAEHVFAARVERALYTAVLDGYVELGTSLFVEKGGDARSSLRSSVRLQGIAPSLVVVADVPLGYAQDLRSR